MAPHAGAAIEPVERQEPVPLVGDELDRVHDEAGLEVVHRVVEPDAAPAGLDALEALAHPVAVQLRCRLVDAEQPVTVRARARTAGARLDPEQVVQQHGDELRVQVVAARIAQVERDDADAPARIGIAEQLDALVCAPALERPADQLLLAGLDALHADAALEFERQRGLQRLQHARRAGAFALLDVGDEVLVFGTHVRHRAAAAHARRQFAVVQALVEDQHAARAGAAQELVRRQEHRVE